MITTKNTSFTALAAVLAGMSMMTASPAQACNDQPYLATVCMTAATFCPRGYAEANGQLLSISDYSALYALMGTNYGGDGRTNFALPDLRGRSGIGLGQGPGLSPVQQGERRGSESTTLSVANMPSHNHSANVASTNGTSAASANSWPANPTLTDRGAAAINGYAASGTPVALNSGVVGSSGNSAAFNNLPPQLGMRFCIATQGLFPPRN